MTAHPEHDLQTKIKQWAVENIIVPHFFFAVDRRQSSGQFSHAREKMRGHVAGMSDTGLLVLGFAAIFVELKAEGKEVKDGSNQDKVGDAIKATGNHWYWTDTVAGYCQILRDLRVPLSNYAHLDAEGKDLTLRGAAIKREESRTGVPSKKRYYKPQAAKPSKKHLAMVASGRWG